MFKTIVTTVVLAVSASTAFAADTITQAARDTYHSVWDTTINLVMDHKNYDKFIVGKVAMDDGYIHDKFTIASRYANEAASRVVFDGVYKDEAIDNAVEHFASDINRILRLDQRTPEQMYAEHIGLDDIPIRTSINPELEDIDKKIYGAPLQEILNKLWEYEDRINNAEIVNNHEG